MVAYKRIRSLGEGICRVCRFRRHNTCMIQKTKEGKTTNERWCEGCFRGSQDAAHSSMA
jgi:hypothetical protein